MLFYFIVFTIIGFVIGSAVRDINKAIPVIIVASVLWGLISAPIWGLATLGELSLGFYIYVMTNKKDNSILD